jgi:hypothetical protein
VWFLRALAAGSVERLERDVLLGVVVELDDEQAVVPVERPVYGLLNLL